MHLIYLRVVEIRDIGSKTSQEYTKLEKKHVSRLKRWKLATGLCFGLTFLSACATLYNTVRYFIVNASTDSTEQEKKEAADSIWYSGLVMVGFGACTTASAFGIEKSEDSREKMYSQMEQQLMD